MEASPRHPDPLPTADASPRLRRRRPARTSPQAPAPPCLARNIEALGTQHRGIGATPRREGEHHASRKPQPALALAAAVVALAVTLFGRRGVIDAVVMIFVGAALVGMYLLRRYARAELPYHRRGKGSPPSARTEPQAGRESHLQKAALHHPSGVSQLGQVAD